MKKLILYIAITEDGFIADVSGRISHLEAFNDNEFLAEDYFNFMNNIEYQIMGENTFLQLRDELSPNFWPHEKQITYVYSNNLTLNTHNIKSTNINPIKLLENIREISNKNIFLVGGANTIKQFIEEKLIDEYMIFWLPIELKNGIYLFKQDELKELKLIKNEMFKNVNKKTYIK